MLSPRTRLSIVLPSVLRAELERRAAEEHGTPSSVTRRLLAKALAAEARTERQLSR